MVKSLFHDFYPKRKPTNMTTDNIKLTAYITFAFIFSVTLRLIWVYNFGGNSGFYWNSELMINTNDGYFFAEGARDIIAGFHQKNDLSPTTQALSITTAFLAKILPFSFESIIFYLPIFFSSLVVIPIVLIGKSIKNLEVGLMAAMLGSVTWSYYNRTMVGYYDTDMLNIVFPTILLWSLIWSIWKKQTIYLAIIAIDIIAYRWWYPQSYSLEFAFFGIITMHAIYIYFTNKKRADSIIFHLMLLSIMLIAMSGFDSIFRLIGAFITILIFSFNKLNKTVYFILPISILVFITGGGLAPILSQLSGYVLRDKTLSTDSGSIILHFYSVNQTIREASKIPFDTFANRISGHTITFIFSVIGYIIMSYRHKIMILALPMIGLGFLAYFGGLRFTIYAVPAMALGIGYLIFLVSEYIGTIIKSRDNLAKYISMTLLFLLALWPNVTHIQNYNARPVFSNTEVTTLNRLKNMSSREDYVISWWDYGYPIRYYSDVKTLIDGGKHNGSVNFPISFMLTSDQQRASKMARLDVEYTEGFKKKTDKNSSSNIEQMMIDYDIKDINKFLNNLNSDIELPNKTRDIFFYLPQRLMQIFPTVDLFSSINLASGINRAKPKFSVIRGVQEDSNYIHLNKNAKIDKINGSIITGNKAIPINRFVSTLYPLFSNHLIKDIQTLDPSAELSVIYMKNYKLCLVLDERMYNSLYVQLFVLENHDSTLFDPVILSPLVKVYKLKI
jgi:dolichyl-diphosphooligosaccharide--protein glycosyltransferase/undecaprenyl-diphosphooligosaccharide--protein glycosyltransferase